MCDPHLTTLNNYNRNQGWGVTFGTTKILRYGAEAQLSLYIPDWNMSGYHMNSYALDF